MERSGHPGLGLPDRRRQPRRVPCLVSGQQHDREPAAPEDRQRLPLSRTRSRIRDRRYDDRVLAGQHLRPRHLGRHPEHAARCRPRHPAQHPPRHPDRRRPAFAQLAAQPHLRLVRRGLPQRAAAAVALPLLQADQRGLSRSAAGDLAVEQRVPQQPRRLFPGADGGSHPQVDGPRVPGRHRRRLVRQPLGQETPGGDRPALPRHFRGPGHRHRPPRPRLAGRRRATPYELARVEGLQLRRRHRHPARVHRPSGRPRALHLGVRRRDRALGHPRPAQGPERGGGGAWPVARPVDAAGAAAAGAAGHRPADDQPVSQHHQEQFAGDRNRLPRPRGLDQRDHQPDRSGDREHPDHHGRLPFGQPVDFGIHELVQQTHRPEEC